MVGHHSTDGSIRPSIQPRAARDSVVTAKKPADPTATMLSLLSPDMSPSDTMGASMLAETRRRTMGRLRYQTLPALGVRTDWWKGRRGRRRRWFGAMARLVNPSTDCKTGGSSGLADCHRLWVWCVGLLGCEPSERPEWEADAHEESRVRRLLGCASFPTRQPTSRDAHARRTKCVTSPRGFELTSRPV